MTQYADADELLAMYTFDNDDEWNKPDFFCSYGERKGGVD